MHKLQFSAILGGVLASLLFFGGPTALLRNAHSFAPITDLPEGGGTTGDWWGVKPKLLDQGIHLEFVFIADVIANLGGGIDRDAAYLQNVDLLLGLDLEKLLRWKGASMLFYGIGNYGANPSRDFIGDFQVADNIEAPNNWSLYEAWFQQNFLRNRVSFLIGLHDLNTNFDVNEVGSVFINSSHGTGAEYAQIGPSIFPNTTLAARLLLTPYPFLYILGGAYNGVSGDPNNLSGIEQKFDNGFLLPSEMGILLGQENSPFRSFLPGKYALGAWVHTGLFPNQTLPDGMGGAIPTEGNWGIYGLINQSLFREPLDPNQGLSAFLRIGHADSELNEVDLYTGGGLVYRGLLPLRRLDEIGVAFAVAYASNAFQNRSLMNGEVVEDAEINIEFTYKFPVFPWFYVQPDFQVIFNPGFDPSLNTAYVFGTRFEVAIW